MKIVILERGLFNRKIFIGLKLYILLTAFTNVSFDF